MKRESAVPAEHREQLRVETHKTPDLPLARSVERFSVPEGIDIAAENQRMRSDLENKSKPFLHKEGKSGLMTTLQKKFGETLARISLLLAGPVIAHGQHQEIHTYTAESTPGITKTTTDTKLAERMHGEQVTSSTVSHEYSPHYEAQEVKNAEQDIDNLAERIRQEPDGSFVLRVRTKSDVAGDSALNATLSEDRALRLADTYMHGLSARGVDTSGISVQLAPEGEKAFVDGISMSGAQADAYAMKKLGVSSEAELHKLYRKAETGQHLPKQQEDFLKEFLNRDAEVQLIAATRLDAHSTVSEATTAPVTETITAQHTDKFVRAREGTNFDPLVINKPENARYGIFPEPPEKTPEDLIIIDKKKRKKKPKRRGEGFIIDEGEGEGGGGDPEPESAARLSPQHKRRVGPMKVERLDEGEDGKDPRRIDKRMRDNSVILDQDNYANTSKWESVQQGQKPKARRGGKNTPESVAASNKKRSGINAKKERERFVAEENNE